MTPERWQQIQDVLEKALQLAPDKRSAFLKQVCSSDPSLRQEVETLLASNPDVRSGFLQSSTLRVTLTPGTKLGDYEVKSLLGSGGMGEVYRARDSRLGRDVAIKVLPALLSADSERLRRFEQEARAAAALNHPNILAVFQMGTYEGAPYLVSELLEGETLRESIRRSRLPVRKAIDYGVQIARGLAAAHEKRIVHRDLKPENLFVTKDGRVKILDFGLAKLTQPQSSSEHSAVTLTEGTEAGTVMGTVGYMSPEQVRGQTADHRADIFAFGAILYEMLAGKRAFQKPTSPETMAAILNEDPPGISQVASNLPPALQRVVHRCLEKNPEQRFQSASDLAFALDALSETSSSAGNAISPPGRKANLWLGVGALVVVIAGITSGLYYWLAPPVPFQKTKITQLTTIGKADWPAISPDGRYVAYVVHESGQQQGKDSLWVRQVGTGSDVQIARPADEKYSKLAFSRDGDFLYFIESDPKDTALGLLYKIPVLGGTAKKLIADVESKVTFSPDGKQLAFVRNSTERDESALIVANEDGSGERQLAVRKRPKFFRYAAWSPNGKNIAAAAMNFESGTYRGSPVEIPVQGGTERPLTQKQWAWIGNLEWTSDGRGLIVITQDPSWGPIQVSYVSYSNGEVHSITNDLNHYGTLSLTADSSVLATAPMEISSDVWVASLAEADNAKPITSGGYTTEATWSPDGKIVCTKLTVRDTNVWVMDSEGSTARQLTANSDGVNHGSRVSPNGRYVVFASLPTSNISHIWRIDIDGDNAKQLTNGPLDSSESPDISPDGKWVVYSKSGAEKGIWRVSIEGGDPVRLNDTPADSPAVSPDGRWIAYSYQDKNARSNRRVAIMAFEGVAPTRRLDIPAELLRWSADGRSLLYTKKEGGVYNIWSQPIAGGTQRQITHFNSEMINSFDLSKDGKRLVMSRGTVKQDVVLIRDLR
jgi:eukaryotic-like serine/threonine-protein kinase